MFLGVTAVVILFTASSCNNNASIAKQPIYTVEQLNEQPFKVLYFHGTRRCQTCQAVETVSQDAIKGIRGDSVMFYSINREDEQNEALVKRYNVSGQTLLLISGEQQSDLTNMAFLNAARQPEVLKEAIQTGFKQ